MATYFYKDGEGKVFEDDKCPEGWTDHPKKAVVKSAPKKKVVKKKAK